MRARAAPTTNRIAALKRAPRRADNQPDRRVETSARAAIAPEHLASHRPARREPANGEPVTVEPVEWQDQRRYQRQHMLGTVGARLSTGARHENEDDRVDRYRDLISRARAGEAILIDGATGSEALRRGAPELPNGWSGGAALSHPDIVRQIHGEYIAIGAQMIASNTFSTGRNVLEDAGVAHDFEAYNRRAVELAVEARDASGPQGHTVVVAAGVSHWSFSGNHPPLDVLRDNTAEQAAIMCDAGADLFSLEMMCNTERLRATLDGVTAGAPDLPIWVGFSIGPEEGFPPEQLPDEIELREGGRLADAVEIARQYDQVDALFMMHSDVRLIGPGVAEIRTRWDGPLGAYAHAAALIDGELVFEDVISPDEYAAYAPAWQVAGATIVGGCCGIGPDHLRTLAATIQSTPIQPTPPGQS